ncbi:MAG: putative Na+/H+ antiporter [Puniceicoccales bacterium]|nr:putative Na+/H+ antiporter [Puniceicoccales bacterium]
MRGLGVFIFMNILFPKLLGADIFPIPLEAYATPSAADGLGQILLSRIKIAPFNFFATLIFLLAIVHTFFAPYFSNLAHRFHRDTPLDKMLATLFHFLGEVEVIFGLWIIPLVFTIFTFYSWHAVTVYFHSVNYIEPLFIVVIMAIASSQPILFFAKTCMQKVAMLGNHTLCARWFSIMIVGPLLGSFITEPAAITISALLLAQQFYSLQPSIAFRYATLGLLFVNISVGGTLTHFAAPPVLMVAGKWHWDTVYMFTHFGMRAFVGIILASALYGFIFRKEFKSLEERSWEAIERPVEVHIPKWVIGSHLLFLFWTIFNIHTPALFIIGFLFFFGFTKITAMYQTSISLRSPILVGFFLAGLVTHGGLQQWWIEPLLGRMNETLLFLGATFLTAFNDNAAITYLASLVPTISSNVALQHAVIFGAVTGGGLTVIANAPNPAGQSILQDYFPGKISPLKLFLSALTPTIILALCFNYL